MPPVPPRRWFRRCRCRRARGAPSCPRWPSLPAWPALMPPVPLPAVPVMPDMPPSACADGSRAARRAGVAATGRPGAAAAGGASAAAARRPGGAGARGAALARAAGGDAAPCRRRRSPERRPDHSTKGRTRGNTDAWLGPPKGGRQNIPNARYLRTAARRPGRPRRPVGARQEPGAASSSDRSGKPALIVASIVRTSVSNTMSSAETTFTSVLSGWARLTAASSSASVA